MKNYIKKMSIITSCITLLLTSNCFAYTLEKEDIKDNAEEKQVVKIYNVNEDEESKFNEELQDKFTLDNTTYTLLKVEKRRRK